MVREKSVDKKPSIDINSLSKRYGSAPDFALKDLSIKIYPGEVYGFLGPNGAGKSTAIKLLLNFLQPTNGSGKILGKGIVKDSVEIKKSIGYLSGDIPLYGKMTSDQLLRYMAELQPESSLTYARQLAKKFHLKTEKKISELSRGNRQKVAIIQAFMHRPEILILDEPTSGLDPLMQEVFFSLVKESKERGATVFVSSHIMSEVQRICDRVGIIKSGKLVGEYTIAELASDVSQIFDIEFSGKTPSKKLFTQIPGTQIVTYEPPKVSVKCGGKLSPLLRLLADYDVTKIDTRSLDLEETFMHFYEDTEGTK